MISETNSYVKSSNQGACCVSSNEQHEGCVIHSTYADVSEQICKRACDNDAFCKGYSISDVNGGMFCRLATSPSQCPHNWDTITGGNAPLNPTAACVSSFSGCYVKQNGIKESFYMIMYCMILKDSRNCFLSK